MQLVSTIHKQFAQGFLRNLLVIEAVEIRKDAGTIVHYNVILLQKEKQKISIVCSAEFNNNKSLEEWVNDTPAGTPIALNINSDKVIHKIVDNGLSGEKYIEELVMNGKANGFYYQQFPNTDNTHIVSIVRKEYVEKIIQGIPSGSHGIINISTGPFFFIDFYKHLQQASNDGHFAFGNYNFLIDNEKVIDFSIALYGTGDEDKRLDIGEENISSKTLIPYCYGLHFILFANRGISLNEISAETAFDEYHFKYFGTRIAAGISLLVFLCLIVSSVLYTTYEQRGSNLELKLSSWKSKWEITQERKKNEEASRQRLLRNGLTDSSSVSFYADQITSVLPSDIYLTTLIIHPPDKRLSSQSTLFNANKIIVEGNCYSTSDIHDWINRLKMYGWVKNIIINDFKQEAGSIGSFSIEITKQTI